MKSLKVGHYSSQDLGTGISVFLFEEPAVAAYHLCGASPATRELHILDFSANVETIHGLVLTGGSAFGLGVTDGVMQYLSEKGVGKQMPHGGVVPIVPTAAIYDLAIQSPAVPTAAQAYEACKNANNAVLQGRIGAGTGASVGKLIPDASPMAGGLGYAELQLENGLMVAAYAVVNAVGDIYDAAGNIIAGARLANGEWGSCQDYLLAGHSEPSYFPSGNTTLVAIFTNAAFSKIALKRIAKMAVAGMAKAIAPVFTRYDGDIIFCVSLGREYKASELTVGAIAAEMVRKAIVNAVNPPLS